MSIEGEPVLQGTADLYLGLSEVLHEQGNQDSSRECLQKSEALGKYASLDEWPYRFNLFKARIKEDEGDLEGALQLLDEAERLYQRSPVPNVRPVAALKARLWIQLGRLKQAMRWSEMCKLSVDDELNYMGEFEHITLARLLVALYLDDRSDQTIHEALQLLERLLKAAEDGGRLGSVIEILIVQALAHHSRGNTSLAFALLERALTLAEPEGYFRVFIAEGEWMRDLLKQVKTENRKGLNYVRKLLAGFEKTGISLASPSTQPLLNPLSERELEVLRLIAQGLSNNEIGKRLFLALDTVKGHNRKIFDKLGVERRTHAIARARKLGLL
jgi:LuxR family maltose regulon positive regulatory protein